MAIYAAVVATAALTVALVSEWRTWATRLEVKMARLMVATAGASGEAAVVFTIINHSGHPVKVTHLGMEPLRKGGRHLFFPQPLPLGVPGPFTVPPRDAITLHQPPEPMRQAADPTHRTRALVSTSDGKTFKSRRTRVGALLDD